MVRSSAAATAESNSWRCDSTVKIFQRCRSEKLQWQEVTVSNSIMYIKAFIHPSLHTGLEGTTALISCNLHYPSIMKFCCTKTNPLHPDCQAGMRNFSMDLTGSGAGGGGGVKGLFNSRGHWNHTCLRSCLVSTWALPPGPPHIANLPHKAVAAKKRPRAVLLGGRPWGQHPTGTLTRPSHRSRLAHSRLGARAWASRGKKWKSFVWYSVCRKLRF